MGDILRTEFPGNTATATSIVIPDANSLSDDDVADYAAALSNVPGTVAVSTPGGSYVDGRAVGPPLLPTAAKDGSLWLSVAIEDPSSDSKSREELLSTAREFRAARCRGPVHRAPTSSTRTRSTRSFACCPFVLPSRRHDHVHPDLPAHRQLAASGEGAGPQHVVAVGHARAPVWAFEEGHFWPTRHHSDRHPGRGCSGVSVRDRIGLSMGLRGFPFVPDPRTLAGVHP